MGKLKKSLILLFIICSLQTVSFAVNSDRTYQLNPAQIVSLRNIVNADPSAEALYYKIQRQADEALKNKPNPIESIQSSGRLQNDPIRIATHESLKDIPKAYSLSIAYIVTNKSQYLAKSKEYLLAWAKINKSTGNPINDTNLEPLIEAYDLIQDQCSDVEKAVIAKWLLGVIKSELFTPVKEKDYNNYNSHRLKIIGLIAFTLKNQKYIEYTIKSFQKQIEHNLYPDGQSFDFQYRDALYYHCYDLEPLLALSHSAKLNGYDFFNYVSPNNCSLLKAVDFLLPFVRGDITHPEFVNSNVAFDKIRADAGQKSFQAGKLFDPHRAVKVLTEYYFFNRDVLALIQRLEKRDSQYPSWEILMDSVQLQK